MYSPGLVTRRLQVERPIGCLPRGAGRCADADGPIRARGFGRIEQAGVEEALRPENVVKRLVVGKPHSQIQREAWRQLPGVLNVPRDVLIEITLENLSVGLCVGIVDTQQRVEKG